MKDLVRGIHIVLYGYRPQGSRPSSIQSATFLVIIGEDARRVYHTFTFANEADRHDLDTLIEKFHAHCKSTVNQTYREFVFGKQNQKPGEKLTTG